MYQFDTPQILHNSLITKFSSHLIHFYCITWVKKFLDQTKLRNLLAKADLPKGGSNSAYEPKHIVESFWLSIWTGASRYIHCDWLRYDAVLQEIFSFKRMPSQSTYSRFFGKFSLARNTRVFPKLQRCFFEQINVGKLTLDLDSSVITRYGEQEGSAKGYNPNKRGRNSPSPFDGFCG